MTVLGIFFLASSVFGTNVFGSNDLIKYVATSLMPLVPKLVETLSVKISTHEKAVFGARLRNSVLEMEENRIRREWPDRLVGMSPMLVVIKVDTTKQEIDIETMDGPTPTPTLSSAYDNNNPVNGTDAHALTYMDDSMVGHVITTDSSLHYELDVELKER